MPAHQRRLRIVLVRPDRGRDHQRQQVLGEGLEQAGHEIVASAALAELLRRARRVQQPDAVVVGPGRLDRLAARLRWPRSRIVVDLHDATVESRRSRAAVRRADLVVVSTPRQAALLASVERQNEVVLGSVGAPRAWFAAAERQRSRLRPDQGTGPMRVISFSGSARLADATSVAPVVGRLADHYVEWTMVGADGEERAVRAALGGRGKVTWIDPRAVDDLPHLVADHDVCLGTFGSADSGRHADVAVPPDLVQAAAAGCAIVTIATSSQREALGDAAVFVPPGNPDAVASRLAALAAEPHELARYRDAATALAARSFMPARVVGELVDRLADGPAVPF